MENFWFPARNIVFLSNKPIVIVEYERINEQQRVSPTTIFPFTDFPFHSSVIAFRSPLSNLRRFMRGWETTKRLRRFYNELGPMEN